MAKPEKRETPEKTGLSREKKIAIAAAAVIIVVVAVAGFLLLAGGPAAKIGDTVSVYYTVKLADGTQVDSNLNGTPLQFTLGNAGIITGFQEAVEGMRAGEQKTVMIPSAKAYGDYRADLVRTMNRTGALAGTNFTAGKSYTFGTAGTQIQVKVLNVTPSTVTIDANNPLAGKDLTFTIRVVSINPA